MIQLGILDFLLDLILDWDDVESYEYLVPDPPEYIDNEKYNMDFVRPGGIPPFRDPPVDVDHRSDLLGGGKSPVELATDYVTDVGEGTFKFLLSISPVPTVPGWLVDLGERVRESDREYMMFGW